MSKKVNKKKNTRNNYKIESLEPRLMMDADVNLEEFGNQIESISTVVDNSISSISNLDLSSLGLDSKLDSASELISNAGDTIKTKIEGIYSSYLSSFESVKIEDLVSALNNNIGDLPSGVSELSFVQEGQDTIKVNFKYNGSPVNTDEWKVPNIGLNADGANFAVNASADLSVAIDLDKDDNGTLLSDGDDVDFSASVNNISVSVPNVGVGASFMNVSVYEEDDSKTDLQVSYTAGNTSSEVDLEFSLDVANSNLPFELEAGKFIEISKPSGSSQFEVDFPEVSLKKSISALLGSIDTKKLPFLNEFSIPFFDENGNAQDYSLAQISDLVKSFDEYWARASLALNGIVETGKMKFGDLQSFFDVLIEKKRATVENIFDSIKIYGPDSATDFAMIFANSSSSIVASGLTELTLGDKDNKKTLTLEFSPNLGNFSKKIDFKLFKLENFDLNATLKIDVNVWLDDEGKLCFDDISLNDFTIKMSKSVDAELQLGLFASDLKGNLTYTISANASGLKDSTLVLHCDTANLKSGPVEIVNVSNSDFTFNMVESVWEFPEEFKQYLALSGETLANNVAIYLNSLRTALRNLIEDKVKLDFLGDSAGSLIADSIAKIDAVIGSGKVKLKDGTDKEINGLFKVDGASLVANFNSVEEFVSQFNDAWSDAFELTHADYCLLKYIGENKNDKTVIKITKDDFESLEDKSLFDFDHYSLVFELNFEILKTLDLNLVDSLGNSFANVSTYGAVSANGSAGIKFSLDVNFSHEKINDNPANPTKIEDFWGLEPTAKDLPANERYYEADLNGGFNGTAKFDVLEYDKNAKIYKTVDSIVLSGKTFTTEKSSVGTYLENNRVIITRDKEFELSSSENQQAYAELGLGGSTLQTTKTDNITDATSWTSLSLAFESKKGSISETLLIKKTVLDALINDGIISSDETDEKAKLKDLLNQYFNLQRNDEFIDLGLGSLGVDANRTIMNTFGLYVVSVEDATSGSGYTIRFGCDPSRIQGYDENKVSEEHQYDLMVGSDKVYMRVSNTLKKTGVIGNNNGLMLEKYTLNQNKLEFTESKFFDASQITGLNTAYSKRGDADSAKSTLELILQAETLGSQFGVDIVGEEGCFYLGISPINLVNEYYEIEDKGDSKELKKYALVNDEGILKESKTIEFKNYKGPYDASIIEKQENLLQKELDALFNGIFESQRVDNGDGTFGLNVAVKSPVTEIYRVVSSDKFLTIDVDSTEIHLDTQKCRDLTTLAQAIISAADKAKVSGINSVAVQGDKIVFAVAEGSTIAWSCGSSLIDKGTNDFIVGVKPVDFETLGKPDGKGGAIPVNKTWTIDDVVEQINNELNGLGISLEYFDKDEMGNPVIVDSKYVYWDHLEFRSKNEFELKNLGSSVVLDKLGFTAKKAVKYADNDYRIVGRALLGIDWSRLIDFTSGANLNVYANASLEIGQEFTASNVTPDGNKIVLISSENLNFVENGLVKTTTGDYYKILGVEKQEITDLVDATKKNITVTLTLNKFSEGDKKELTSETNPTNVFRYMGGAVATVGFVDVNLVASGSVGFEATFDLNVFDPNVAVKDNVVQNYELQSPDTSVKATADLELDVDSFVDIGDNISEGLGQVKISLGNDGKFDASNNLDAIVSKAISKFGSFSAEDLFAILDSFVKRLADIADKSNVKIPVINKSVSDLVDVANNIRDIVTKLRTDKVFSLQGLNDRLNKYLKDFGLLAHDGVGSVLANANPFEISLVGSELFFSFNIDKKFDTVHQFSFGDDNQGISGNADLKVTGDFWVSFSGKAILGTGTFDIGLDKAIEFGANVNIVGEKLSFNLGLDNIADTELLANLITVGSNKSDSYVCAKAALMGTIGQNGMSLKEWKAKAGDGSVLANVPFDFAVPVAIMGKLPISVCNMSLGDILLGIGDNGELSVEKTADEAKTSVGTVIANYINYWKNKNDGDDSNDIDKPAGLISFESLNPKDFFKLITNSTYSDSAGKIVADFSGVYKGIQDLITGNVGWFEKIKLAITGFNKLFDTLEASLNNGMMSSVRDVPVVGSALSGGVDFLGDLKRKVLEPLSNFLYESTGMNAEMVAQKLNELFGTYLHAVSIDNRSLTEDWTPSATTDNQTFYRQGTNNDGKKYAEWFLSIGDDYSYGTDIGFDLGFPGLGLKSDAGVNLSLGWRLDFGFGVSEDGFYFIFNDGNEVQVDATVAIEGDIMGSLAGLGLKMVFPEGSHPVSLDFGVDLNSDTRTLGEDGKPGTVVYGKNQLDFSKFSLGNIDFNYDAIVDISPDITVGIVSDLNKVGDAPKFPNLIGNFDFHWNAEDGITALGFNNFKLDMGTFIGGVLGPIVSKIQKVVEPLEPLIDFLTTPFPVLDDLGFTYTPLSLAKQFSKGKFDDRMVYAVKDLIEISKKITAFGDKDLKIDIGSLKLIDGLAGDAEAAKKLLTGSASSTSLDNTLNTYLFDKNGVKGGDFSSVSREASSSLMSAGLNVGDGAWRFVWDNPTDVFKLLLGQDIMLVEYDMPKLSFNFDWSTFVRIYGPLGARIGLSLGADIDLGFGYDTLGIRQWVGSDYKDFSRLLNGFYVNDLRDGADIDELSFHGALTAAAELNAGVSAGVGGGVGINVGFNLYDPNKDGKIRLNEITRLFDEEGLFGMFDVNGKITAKLYAYVDLLFYTKEWNITGDKTLFKFEHTHTAKPVMNTAQNGNVVANVGENASSRVSDDDGKYPLIDGSEYVHMTITGNTIKDDYGHETQIDETGTYYIPAGKDNDRIVLEGKANFNIEIKGEDGDDYIDLSKLEMVGNHYVLITGGAGKDTIIGAQGLNIIFGDAYVVAPTVDWEGEGENAKPKVSAEANVDAQNSGGDVILGGSKMDFIFGGAGDDQIDGGDGIDYIFGDGGRIVYEQTGADDVKLAIDRTDMGLDGGNDKLIGGKDNDVIYGSGGNDHIDGGADDDEIYGETGHDRILGGSGDDTIHGGEGMDIVFGDRIENNSKDVTAPFAVDASNTKAAFSQEFIDAQLKDGTSINAGQFAFDDYARSALANLKGNLTKISEDDVLGDSKNGNDTIYGDDGNDLLFGDDGSDSGDAVGGIDNIYGGIGNDVIDGDAGNDTIEGGIDNDIIYGGAGDDIIDGGAGNDSIYGDNGVTDYKKKSGTSDVDADELVNENNAKDKVVFGDNLGLHGVVFANATSNSKGGNDTIKTGPGMDFVDGQDGSDKVTVKLMGDSTTNYANVTDSGTEGADTLVVEGTESVDRLLLRQNKDQNLGLVALLPMKEELLDDDSKANVAITSNLNSNIERVNYTAGIESLNVNANGGNDQIYVDGTAHKTTVDGGAGNDNFYVGQIYNSERKPGNAAEVQPIDEFNTQKNNEEGYVSDGVSSGTVLNLEGGSGEDNFVALNNVGTLSMSGGKDNDNFSMYSFRKDGSGDAFERGAVLIEGGKGDDTLKVRGTDNDDVFVVTKEGMLSDLIAISASGVESSQFDAAAGDDMFHVVGNKADDMTELYGGKGNDTFSMGGLDQVETLRSANTDGQSVNVKYEFLTDEGLTDEQKAELDQNLIDGLKSNGAIDESFTVVDSDTEAAVFIVKNVGTDALPDYQISESSDVFLEKEGDVASFFVGCAGLENGKTLNVTVSAPILSTMDFNRGDRGFQVSEDGVNWGTTITVHPTADQPARVFVRALADTLEEEGVRKSIAITSEVCVGSAKSVLTKSVNSVGLVFKGENKSNAQTSFAAYPLTYTDEFIIGSNQSFKLNAISDKDLDLDTVVLNFYVNGVLQQWQKNTDFTVADGAVTIGKSLPLGGILTINVRSKNIRLDDSRLSLAYEDVSVSSVTVGGESVSCGYSDDSKLFYELNGNVITFYNAITKQPMTVHGVVSVEATLPESYVWEQLENAAATTSQAETQRGMLKIDAHDTAIAETAGSGFNSVSYNVTFDGTIADGKKVFVKISPTELLANSNADEKSQRLSISCAGFETAADGSIILSFDSTALVRTITVSAVADGEVDDYGLTEVPQQDERIEDIDGPVYAYGYGESMNLNMGEPAMLNYKHVIESGVEGQKPEQAANYNELNNFEQNKLLPIELMDGSIAIDLSTITDEQKAALLSVGIEWKDDLTSSEFYTQFDHKSFKWTNEREDNFGTQSNPVWKTVTTVASAWSRIESASVVPDTEDPNKFYLVLEFEEELPLPSSGSNFALISVNRDSLFIDEMASVDRLFVNNQKSDADSWSSLDEFKANDSNEAEGKVDSYDTHALRFTHGELDNTNGITAAQMEYAEYNLGTGKDTVDINKTLYREDAFRTYTVVNTGDAKDRDAAFGISIGKAEISSDNLTNGANYITDSNVYKYDLIPAEGSEISVIKTSANTTVYYVQAEIRKLNSESETGYDVVGIQRREVLGSFSSTMGFYVKYDFILAEGEYIGEFEFFQAEFDDYIRVNKYKADGASADNVICSGVIAEVAPVQEETGDDNAETGDETDTEGDGEATEGGEGAVEGEDEETTPAEEVAGFAYSYTMAESDAAKFEKRMATFQAWQSGLTSAANGYVYGIFVDATMSDGSVQRRFVTELTANTFRISRDFTLSEGLSIVSLRFAYSFEGDGQLVVNAQAGHDRIDASSSDVTRNDMVAFGGFGDDYITMNKGGIAFGDRGQVRYENGQVNGKDVYETILGSTDGDGNHNNGLDYTTGIDKRAEEDTNEQPQYRLQTNGVNRDASEIRSMDDSNEQNGIDLINVGGTNSVVIGGDKADVIVIGGDKNVALGDNGRVLYNNAQNDNAVYGDKLGLGMHIVETTSDDIGDVDNIVIGGDKNVAMGGAKGDSIRITGADNVAIGDGGRYTIEETRLYAESKTDDIGGQDFISTGDGKNAVIGGTDKDWIYTGAGNDAIIGDGGKVIMDTDRNALMVTNEGRNIKQIDKDEQVSIIEDNSAGADHIEAGNGDNVVFGGLDSDDITTGNGQDVVFGDNAYATFRGNANEAFEQVGDRQNVPDVYEEATLSFNFQGASQTGLNAGDFVGAYNEQYGDDYRSSNWNNISGSLAGTYGNDDREVVNMDNLDATGEKSADETRVRASGVSVSYGGIESHRNTSTDNRINLQAYNLGLWNAQYDKNAKLMNSGLMTTAPNAQCENKLDVQMDGLAQYFTSYRVVVYLDIPDSHSAANNSIRKVSLYTNDSEDPIKTFYVKDNAGHNFHGSYERSTAETAASAMEANYVVFTVDEGVAADRIRVVIEEADPNAQNGKNLPGIAAIQVRGTLHKQDVAATTDIDFGGNDTIRTDLGDDIVVGGTGGDDITTFGDERYGIHDNDVVFGDNAKILLTDRDSDESTASTISTAESVAITNIDAIYDDLIKTGNGNDTVVGGIGADTINAEATAAADTMLEDINVLSINFTREHSDSTDAIAQGEAAGVVVDTDWHNFYRNDRGVIVSESVRGQESSPEYNNKMNSLSNNPTASNPYAVEEGVEVQLYGKNHGQRQTVASFTIENYDELDGDTSNSKLFNTYLAAQQSEEIVLKLKNMNSFVSNSNNTVSSTYDLYIYLGGDNNDTDTYNYLYQVKFTGHNGVSQYRYLNDWTGHKFDGDYKEATCSSQTEAERMLQMALNESAHDSAAPRLELVGNYVVFRGVSGDVADIRIKNIYTSSGQHPKNLPMISAVQVVSGDGRYAAETDLGGDHDKDLVYGDDAKLVFDMDVPYDADVADVSKFKNRVIEAKSVAIEHDAVTSISTNDTITTGRDRDVAVGGEGADTITMGEGDDIALGGSANLVLEHNNPLGVFTPNTEIALDQHTIDTTQHQNYLDNDNANKWQFQSRLDQNHIQGIDTSVSNENDRKDTIDVGEGRNLTSQGSDSTAQLVVPKPVVVEDDGQEGSGEASTPTPPVSGQDSVRQFVLGQREVMSYVEISAGQTIEIVLTDWNEGDQYYHPNIVLQMSATDNVRHNLSVTWDGLEEPKQVSLLSYGIVDIPDSANVVGEHKIVLRVTCDDDIVFMASAGQR